MDKVKAWLKKEGLMTAAGLAAFEARTPEKTAVYSYESKEAAKLPPEYEKLPEGQRQEVLRGPGALVSPHGDPQLGDERQERGDARNGGSRS